MQQELSYISHQNIFFLETKKDKKAFLKEQSSIIFSNKEAL